MHRYISNVQNHSELHQGNRVDLIDHLTGGNIDYQPLRYAVASVPPNAELKSGASPLS